MSIRLSCAAIGAAARQRSAPAPSSRNVCGIMIVFPILVVIRGTALESVTRDARVQRARPCIDAAFEVEHLAETVPRKELCHASAASPGLAKHDDRLVLRQLVEAGGHFAHRNMEGAR